MTLHLTGEWALVLSLPFLAALVFFVIIMATNRRSLWSGAGALCLLFGTGLSILCWIFFYGQWIMQHRLIMAILVGLLVIVALILLAFPFLLAGFLID